ncbi:hypothetical protein MKX03_000675 [Papaver bracteatum]|nr:hypothetical protein MKX03_000675 [Papaver bracteatum]
MTLRNFLDTGGGRDADVDESTLVFNFKQHVKPPRLNRYMVIWLGWTKKDTSVVVLTIKKRQQEAAKRMQELIRQFAMILPQVCTSTVAIKMETKDGTGYKDVREIYADAKLVVRIKMEYNEEKSDAANAKLARDIINDPYEVDMHLEELREVAVQKCRKMSVEEKRKLGLGHSRLSPEDLSKSETTLWRLKVLVKRSP